MQVIVTKIKKTTTTPQQKIRGRCNYYCIFSRANQESERKGKIGCIPPHLNVTKTRPLLTHFSPEKKGRASCCCLLASMHSNGSMRECCWHFWVATRRQSSLLIIKIIPGRSSIGQLGCGISLLPCLAEFH